MNENDLLNNDISRTTSADTIDEGSGEDRVFDISGDTISLVTEETSATTNPWVMAPKQAKPTATQVPPKIPPIPLDTNNLLDKKIGNFDSTPFAQKKTSEPLPGQTVITPKKPSGIPLQEIPTLKAKPVQSSNQPIPVHDAPKFGPDAKLKSKESEPIPEIQPDPSAIPPANSALTNEINSILKPLRTYESDVADVMAHKKTSVASIAIAETRKEEGNESIANKEPSQAGKKIFMILLSLILLGGGTIAAYYFYSISPLAPVAPKRVQQQITQSIIPSNSYATVILSNQSPLFALSAIKSEIAKPQEANTIKELIIGTPDTADKTIRVSGPEMIQIMDIDAPDILVRSLTPEWMLGVYTNAENTKDVFAVVTTNFFQNTFAGMLQWENVMADDLKQYLYTDAKGISNQNTSTNPPVNGTSDPLSDLNSILPVTSTTSASTTSSIASTSNQTSTSTTEIQNGTASSTSSEPMIIEEPIQPYFTISGRFEDKIIKNKDVRAFITNEGKTLFLYSFIDNTHLVITGSEQTLAEILTRLEKQSFIR